MKQAVIDIGSNSMRLTVYETTPPQIFRVLFKEKIMAGLAGYVEHNALSPDGIERAILGLLSFRATLSALDIKAVAVFATASLRNVKNTDQAVAAIQRATGYPIEVISGEEEAAFGYAGAMQELDLTDGLFVDIGGASTEVVRFAGGVMESANSCPVGSLKLYRDFVRKILPNKEAIHHMEKAITMATLGVVERPVRQGLPLVCVGGTARAALKLAKRVCRLPETSNSITIGQLDRVCQELCASQKQAADLSFDREKFEDSDRDFRTMMTQMLKKRANQAIVRLEMDRRPSQELLRLLGESIQVQTHQIYCDSAPLAMGYVYGLENALPEDLRRSLTYQPYTPRWPEDLSRQESMIEQIQRKDRLLFFPFDSIDPFLKLLEEAAERPDVKSIKITIYRLASTSKIARILCRAAENGKEVVALMELRARFDEANNIAWSKMLEEAGCKVIYGMENFKCHSKLCLITLQDKKGTHYITQVGTGNYNEKTSALYTDLSVMTASPSIGADGAAFFRNMLTDNLEGSYQTLWVAPYGLKPRILALIDEQIAKGSEGYLCFKVNSVTEREVIDKLRQASQAGVEIKLIVRGICCLRPGVLHQTENIQVTSIVGRYLEHACPIFDPAIQDQLRYLLDLQLQDNAKASFLQPSGAYLRKEVHGPRIDSQAELMKTSLHRPEPDPVPRPNQSFFQRLMALLRGA